MIIEFWRQPQCGVDHRYVRGMGAYDITRNVIIQNAKGEEAAIRRERGESGDRPQPYRGGEQPENRRGSNMQVVVPCSWFLSV